MSSIICCQIICLSATTNKLSNIQKQAEEYAALIMEELDPDGTGFIMVIITYYVSVEIHLLMSKHSIWYLNVRGSVSVLELIKASISSLNLYYVSRSNFYAPN